MHTYKIDGTIGTDRLYRESRPQSVRSCDKILRHFGSDRHIHQTLFPGRCLFGTFKLPDITAQALTTRAEHGSSPPAYIYRASVPDTINFVSKLKGRRFARCDTGVVPPILYMDRTLNPLIRSHGYPVFKSDNTD